MSAGAPQSIDDRIERLQMQLRMQISDYEQPRLVQNRIDSARLQVDLKRNEWKHATGKLLQLEEYADNLPGLIEQTRADLAAAQHEREVRAVAPVCDKFLALAKELGIDSPEKFREYLAAVDSVKEVL